MGMIPQLVKENSYSKNIATINYWLREMNFPNYDSLHWNQILGDLVLRSVTGKYVAKVTWFTIAKNGIEYHIPMFKFYPPFLDWDKNQLNFWICRSITHELELEEMG